MIDNESTALFVKRAVDFSIGFYSNRELFDTEIYSETYEDNTLFEILVVKKGDSGRDNAFAIISSELSLCNWITWCDKYGETFSFKAVR